MAETQVNIDFDVVNFSLQVGDIAFVSDVLAGDVLVDPPIYAGIITGINSSSVVVDGPDNVILPGQFFSFSKNNTINESSLKGYYANITFQNYTNKYAELFSIGSEVVPSSK